MEDRNRCIADLGELKDTRAWNLLCTKIVNIQNSAIISLVNIQATQDLSDVRVLQSEVSTLQRILELPDELITELKRMGDK